MTIGLQLQRKMRNMLDIIQKRETYDPFNLVDPNFICLDLIVTLDVYIRI